MTMVKQTQTAADTTPITLEEAAAFVWTEAELLDRLAYREWLPLWTDDGIYAIPIERDGGDPTSALNIAYDDAVMREARVKRLLSGFSMSSAPPARTVRTLSRFVVDSVDAVGMTMRAAQILVEYKYGRTRVLGADVTFRLERRDGAIRMKGKSILLLNSDEDLFGIGYLL